MIMTREICLKLFEVDGRVAIWDQVMRRNKKAKGLDKKLNEAIDLAEVPSGD